MSWRIIWLVVLGCIMPCDDLQPAILWVTWLVWWICPIRTISFWAIHVDQSCKRPKGGVVTRTAGGFVSNTSMFHRAWRRKDGLLCESSQLDISFPQFWWTSPTSPYAFWVFGVLLAIPDPSSENQQVPGKYPEVSCSFPIPQAISGLLCLQGFFGCNLSWRRLEVLSRTWISKYQNLAEFKISKKCVCESTDCKKSKLLHRERERERLRSFCCNCM